MNKINKKELRELIKDGMEGNLYEIGAYIYNNKVELFLSYHGQGLDAIVYNEEYDSIVEFNDLCTSEYALIDAVDLAYDKIEYMIFEYENQ